ncbi:MAG: hypothetical protein IH914_11335 [candidate division Zixibacteria bacterium]|nr:hypothetical protein [candidate division Zixibacteria bacterium]
MGHGLALEFARAGYQVLLYDSIAAQRDSAPERLRSAYKTMSDMGMADAAAAGVIDDGAYYRCEASAEAAVQIRL